MNLDFIQCLKQFSIEYNNRTVSIKTTCHKKITGPYSLNGSTSGRNEWLKLRLFIYYLWGTGLP
jgi:hypothetical protein